MATIPEAFAIAIEHHRAGRLQAAEQIYRQILQIEPNQAETLHLLGVIAHQAGQHEAVVELIAQAIALNGAAAEFHENLGSVYLALRRIPEAVASYRRALEIRPGLAETHCNLGIALIEQGSLEEAIVSCRRALELNPNYAEAHNALGSALAERGELTEAIASHRRALQLKPDYGEAHNNLGLLLLALGQYEEGWNGYEHRLECSAAGRKFAKPRLSCEQADGQTVLLHSEQGFGDVLQFARYLPLVRRKTGAKRVILEIHPKLARLFAQNDGWDAEIVAAGGSEARALPPYDCHSPLLSLPLTLGIFEPLPMAGAYLRADPELRAIWRERLGPASSPRIGLAWAGSPGNIMDRTRSIQADLLTPLLRMKGFEFYSLQIGPQNRAPALEASGLSDLTAHIADFADTAALVAELDLIISVDTAVAHLAGAMGRPVWTLLASVPDWRWGSSGTETPWYPTMQLFRQRERGDWPGVVQDVAAALIGRYTP